jgi:WD40 repeat protein/predicted Ser/Thr protein kinase
MAAHPDSNRRDGLLARQRDAWSRGVRLSVEALLAEHPEVTLNDEFLLELVHAECLLLRASGECVAVDEFVRRFPHLAVPLTRLIDGDEALATEFRTRPGSPLSSGTTARGERVLAPSEDLQPTDPYATQVGSDPAQQETLVAADVHGRPLRDATSLTGVSTSATLSSRYRIQSEVARGGMGVVYRAHDLQLDRVVALKLIRSGDLADGDEIKRFAVEARAAAQLDHSGIVQVYEVGTLNGQPFLTMAFIDGQSLWQAVKDAPLAPKRAARIMQQAAEAVHYAHEHGVVHRDLKPQNILLTRDDQPKVTDFGLAKRQQGDSSLTETGQALGTPSYMPPEQAQGKIKEVGPIADVYSLGATLYCLLTGRPPFQAANPLETMLQVVEQEPVSPKSLNRAVSVDLETICLRCLEKDPAKRYPSAAALGQDLARYLAGEPIQARPVGRLERALKWIARKPVTAAAYGLTALTVALVMIGTTIAFFWRNAETARSEAESARSGEERARKEAERAKQQEERAKKEVEVSKAWNDYVLNVRLAPTLWDKGWVEVARRTLEACPPKLREQRWEWNYYQRHMHPEVAALSAHTKRVLDLELSPDESCLATCREGVSLWDAASGEQIAQISNQDGVRSAAFSRDGKWLATGTDSSFPSSAQTPDGLILWDRERQRVAARVELMCGVIHVAFHPSGDRILAGLQDGRVLVCSVPDLKEIPQPVRHPAGAAIVACRPDGHQVATGCWNGFVNLWNPLNGHWERMIPAHSSGLERLQYSPDGRRLVSVGWDRAVKIWDAATGDQLASWSVGYYPKGVAISRDCRTVSFGRPNDPVVEIRDLVTGQVLRELRVDAGLPISTAFSPDNQLLATGWENGAIRFWDTATGDLQATLLSHASSVSIFKFSEDGTRLYSADFAGQVRIWDLTRPAEAVRFGEASETVVGAVSSDGRMVACATGNRTISTHDLITGEQRVLPQDQAGKVACMTFRPATQSLATGHSDGSVRLWNIGSDAEPVVLRGHARRINRLAYDPRGETLATASDEGEIRLWNADNQKEISVLRGHQASVLSLAFDPESYQLASTAADATVRLWNARSGKELATWKWTHSRWAGQTPEHPLAYHPRRRWVAAALENVLKIRDTETYQEIARIETPNKLTHLEFSPDGRWMAYAGYFQYIVVWNCETRREVARLPTFSEGELRFSPDGRKLAQASGDNSIRLWDTERWEEIATLTGHQYPVALLQYDPAGDSMVSVSHDGTIRRWVAEESSDATRDLLSLRPRIWRVQQLERAEAARNWYAAAFHLDWLQKHQPSDVAWQTRYQQAVSRRDAEAADAEKSLTALASSPPISIHFDTEREAAEWVLSVGGTVGLIGPYGESAPVIDRRLPGGPFAIMGVSFNSQSQVRNDEFIKLSRCRRLASIMANGSALNGSGLSHLKPVRSLQALHLAGLTDPAHENKLLTDKTLASIAELTQLKTLQLASNRALTDASLVTVARLTDLENLYLDGVSITDAGLKNLQTMSKLKSISVAGTGVTDQGLARLIAQHPNLTEISLAQGTAASVMTLESLATARMLEGAQCGGDQVTASGIAALAQLERFHKLQVIYPTPGSIARLDLPRLKTLSVEFCSVPIAEAEARAILKSQNVESLQFVGRAGSPDDATLLMLATLPKLKSFTMSFSEQSEPRRYTAAGIERFRKSRPDVELNIDGRTYSSTR